MAQKESYYKVLGVDKSATPEEIKKAFRKKAAKAHPDVGGDEEEFKKINEAYEVLSNPEKRKQYDTYGQYMGSMPGGGAGAYGAGAAWPGNVNVKWTNMGGDGQGFGGFGDFDLGDIFNRVSHGEGVWGTDWEMPKRPMRGRDLQATLNLSFDEAFNGTTKRLSVRIPSSGKTQHVTVKVPAGAVDGGKLRYRGKGDEGLDGGEPGDLVIVTKVAPHPLFTRKGADVLMDLPVTYPEAALGSSVVIPTPDGSKAKIRIPAGTKDGAVLRLTGKGAPKLKGDKGRGALKLTVRIAVPSELTAEQRELLEKLAGTMDPDAARPDIAQAAGTSTRKA